MAATGYTPIYLYYSSTATNAPVAGNLGYGELAINITDGYLFYKDNANAIQKIGYKLVPVTAGGTGLTSVTAGYIPFGSTASALSSSSNLFWDSANNRLGIGTTSPTNLLTLAPATGGGISLGDRATTGTVYIGRTGGGALGGNTTSIGFVSAGGSSGDIQYQAYSGNHIFYASPTTQTFKIDSSGHVTVEGVTSTGATGSGKFVFDTSPTLVTPALGTPSSGALTNCTSIPSAQLTGTISNARFPTGTILQVVYGATATGVSATTTTLVDTGVSVSITPTRSSSTIAVFVSINGLSKDGNTGVILKVLRGATIIDNMEGIAGFNASGDSQAVGGVSQCIIDSPGTTSSTTYKVQLASYNGNSVGINSNGGNTANTTSSILVMEIAG